MSVANIVVWQQEWKTFYVSLYVNVKCVLCVCVSAQFVKYHVHTQQSNIQAENYLTHVQANFFSIFPHMEMGMRRGNRNGKDIEKQRWLQTSDEIVRRKSEILRFMVDVTS